MNEITIDQALRAMIEREGDAYNEAIKKANFEFGIGAMGSLVGIPAKAYPEGEYLQRSLKDDYQRAWAKTEETGNYDFVNNFNELHPEYEARLALWKSPEERLRSFLVDDIWNIWFDLPSLTKQELIEQLGEDFEEKFMNEDTRSYESINLGEMQGWLKLMGGDPPGTLESEPAPIDLADPEVAWRVQVFRDTRLQYFGEEIFDIQNGYYDIPEKDKNARKAYRANNPALVAYWEWRRDWMHRNPETVPYLTEKDYEFKYSSPEAKARAAQPQPWMTWDEWTQYMGPNMSNLMEDHFVRDYDIPEVLQERMEELAGQLGLGYGDALDLMRESIFGQETPPQIEPQTAVPFTENAPSGVESQTRQPDLSGYPPGTTFTRRQDGSFAINVPKGEYDFNEDDRLTERAKSILRRVGRFSPEQVQFYKERRGELAFQIGLPESIQRREEGGFMRRGVVIPEGYKDDVELNLHELAHAIDAEEGEGDLRISDNSNFQKDAQRYMKEYEPEYPDTNNVEWFAMLFARSVTGSREVPSYIKKWFKPYIK